MSEVLFALCNCCLVFSDAILWMPLLEINKYYRLQAKPPKHFIKFTVSRGVHSSGLWICNTFFRARADLALNEVLNGAGYLANGCIQSRKSLHKNNFLRTIHCCVLVFPHCHFKNHSLTRRSRKDKKQCKYLWWPI